MVTSWCSGACIWEKSKCAYVNYCSCLACRACCRIHQSRRVQVSGDRAPGWAGFAGRTESASAGGRPVANSKKLTVLTPATTHATSRVPAALQQAAARGETVTLPVRDALAALTVRDESRVGYERTKFKHWTDADRDGCNTRAEILNARDLIAVSAASNRSKADKDPNEWLPPYAGYQCQYDTDWIADKTRWGLSVDAAKRDALTQQLAGCPDRPITVTVAR